MHGSAVPATYVQGVQGVPATTCCFKGRWPGHVLVLPPLTVYMVKCCQTRTDKDGRVVLLVPAPSSTHPATSTLPLHHHQQQRQQHRQTNH